MIRFAPMGNSSNHRSWQAEFRSIPADRAAQIVSHSQEPEGRRLPGPPSRPGAADAPWQGAQPVFIVSGIV
jgi:hypothetical protein